MKKNIKINKEKLLFIVITTLILLLVIFLSLKDIIENLNLGQNSDIKMIQGEQNYYFAENNASDDMCIYLSDIEYDKKQSSVEWGSITIDSNLETQYNNG